MIDLTSVPVSVLLELHGDLLAAVLLDGKFRVLRAAIIPYEVVSPRAAYVDSVKGWKFILRDSVWDIDGVADVTATLKAAELKI